MSFCFLYNVVSENHSVQNSPWGGGGSIASSRSINCTESSYQVIAITAEDEATHHNEPFHPKLH